MTAAASEVRHRAPATSQCHELCDAPNTLSVLRDRRGNLLPSWRFFHTRYLHPGATRWTRCRGEHTRTMARKKTGTLWLILHLTQLVPSTLRASRQRAAGAGEDVEVAPGEVEQQASWVEVEARILRATLLQ